LARQFKILVADRNKHVREFLKRELACESLCVDTAGDGKEVLERIDAGQVPDLLILDLELPVVDGCQVASELRQLGIKIPVVVHSFPPDNPPPCPVGDIGLFVEKSGENIQKLREVIWNCLKDAYPALFSSSQDSEKPRETLPVL
jgi:response regulator RpfG family c-di-GMP phosphodiesterase